MDLLQKCAVAFDRLTGYQYRFTLGRKGKLKEIVLGFDETDFHHLAGLHKLKDINIARDNRQTVFRDILSGRITYQTIEKSCRGRCPHRPVSAVRRVSRDAEDSVPYKYAIVKNP